ncbi:hypothetical protein OEZ86_002342 [Tetradesmus obliquus]|nr:hypothetical protein OEZ86_002342 [Tetradesmus obliquus]
MRSEQGRVVVKARPTFVPAEQEALGDSIFIPSTGKVALASGKDREAKEFTADGVYLPRDGDEAVYEQEVQPLVHSVHQGFNATILAYGASGSGKTYTMLGNRDSPGLANRIIDELFAFYDPRTCTLAVSIQELYNENFMDLVAALPGQAAVQPILATPRQSAKLTTKSSSSSNSSKGPARLLEGKEVRSSKELKQLVHAALRKRKTAATVLNETSSRSHAIITLTLQQRKRVRSDGVAISDDDDSDSSPASSPGASRAASRRCSSSGSLNAEGSSAALESPRSEGDAAGKAGDDGVFTYLTGKLYLVDLAGSENIKRSGAEGKQQVEAGDINKSLCHLKTVIDQVFQGKKVPTYRNSKLTYKLRDALGGGNSKLLVIACISTARENLALTKETLRFAEMARAIKNKPTVNRELKDEIITRLQQQIEELQDQLAKAAVLNKGVGSDKVLLQQLNAVQAAYAELREETTPVAAAVIAEEPCRGIQLPEQRQQQQQGRKQNSRYEQLPGQPEEEDETEQQQGREVEAGDSEEDSEAAEPDEGGDGELASESGYEVEPSLAGGSSAQGSSVSDRESLSLADDRADSPFDGSSASLASAHLAHIEEPVVQHGGRQQQQQQQQQPSAPRSSGGSVRVSLPRLSMAGLQEAAAAPAAEGGQAAAGTGSSWPSVYRPEHELDVEAAQRAFAELAGEELKVEPLKAFLKGCRMGGALHSMSLPCGTKRKLKQHLVQDRRAGPAAVAEGIVGVDTASGSSSLACGGGSSAVELLMLQMQSDPTLGSPGPAVPLEALMAAGFGSSAGSSAAGDVRVLQQGASLAHRSSWRHTQARAAAKAARR